MRLDGKPADTSNKNQASKVGSQTKEEKEEYDPRKHKLQNGVVYIIILFIY